MRRIYHSLSLFVVGLFLFSTTGAQAQQPLPTFLEGTWWFGMLEEAMLPINLHFDSAKALLYSPMQTDQAMEATDWSFRNDTLRVSYKPLNVRLVMCWDSVQSSFSGTFRQSIYKEPLVMYPADGLFEMSRPQEPQPPYPYVEEDFQVVRKKAGVTLTGTLTLPEGTGPFPAVVLISGSGQQDRNEEIMRHKPFLLIADYLTRNGIAVLRYDDRGVGGSRGEVKTATTLDFADDVESLWKALRKDPRIDKRRVGLLGHSEGGVIAPIVASRNRGVAFVVMLAGPGGTGAEILLEQNERLFQLGGADSVAVALRVRCLDRFFNAMATTAVDDYPAVLQQIVDKECAGMDNETLKAAQLRSGDLMALNQQMQVPWMQTFIRLDNRDYLRKTRCPILAINGSRDSQVVPDNLLKIKAVTDGRAQTVLLPDLNHLMQHCLTGKPSEYGLIEETMSTEVLRIVSEWIISKTAR
ncbi:MAG: alpha/beta hydrolase [Bacteroidales bacterium]|nr:alpha/beta hydrolase [Bacteroidales bacterium]